MVALMNTSHGVSIRRGCETVFIAPSTYRYERKPRGDEMIIDALDTLVGAHPSIGFYGQEA